MFIFILRFINIFIGITLPETFFSVCLFVLLQKELPAFHLLISFIGNVVKNTSKIFSIYLPEKGFGCAIFCSFYIIKNRWLIPFFLIKTKLMKCYTVRYIKVSIPKCYLSDFPKTRTSPLRYRHIAGHFESFNCLKFQTSFLKNKSFLWKIRLLISSWK